MTLNAQAPYFINFNIKDDLFSSEIYDEEIDLEELRSTVEKVKLFPSSYEKRLMLIKTEMETPLEEVNKIAFIIESERTYARVYIFPIHKSYLINLKPIFN